MRVSHFSSTALEKPLTSMLSPSARGEATAAMLHDYPKCHKNLGCDNPSIAVRAFAPPTVILIPQGREKNLGSISTDSSGKNTRWFNPGRMLRTSLQRFAQHDRFGFSGR